MGLFLGDRRDERVWTVAREKRGLYWTGEGQNALEVVYVESASEPSRSQVSKLWHERQGRRAAPVLLVVAWSIGDSPRAWLCGPLGEAPPMAVRDLGQAERIAAQALSEPSRTFAIQYLNGALAEVDDPLPGVRNDGLLATHELRKGVRLRRDWKAACERSQSLVNLRDRALVEGLGYRIEQRGDHAVLRAADGEKIRAVAVFLDRGERPDRPSARFDQRTPVTHALTLADREGLRWVVAVRGSTLRLYSTATSGAAGQRGRTDTFVELDLPLLADEHAGYLSLLFAADALATGGTFDEIAAASRDFTTSLSERMRERIYERTVPDLALAIARRHDGPLDQEALGDTYHAALTVLFRLLFIAYAEDQRLLPYAASEDYRANSLKAIAQRFASRINAGEPLGFTDPFNTAGRVTQGDGTDELWSRCRALFQAVDQGNRSWDIPPYNGGLFSKTSAEGARIAGLSLTNAEFGPALAALLLDRTPDGGIGPIDFRSLSVREFGSIYEGLLESDLAVAEQDLALKSDAEEGLIYVPAGDGDEIIVPAGAAYLHNSSGARKATGSYFTPAFAVDHLLDTALRPALSEHLDKVEGLLDAGDEVAAAELLLDFRVADISMGSGHFLTAAIDAIEAMVTDFLARRPIPAFSAELARLHRAANDALGSSAVRYDIEGAQLLRRLIARRCIYGVDINPISVELARVSVWIHTFVPGLPLSFLDRTLVVGDSLAGIGTVSEALEALVGTSLETGSFQNVSFFDDPVREGLRAAEEPLRRLGAISDATLDEVTEALAIARQARAAVQPVSDLFDLIVAQRLGEVHIPPKAHFGQLPDEVVAVGHRVADELGVIHFPVAFPEVFLRDRGGFDVIVGNPPWEELRFDTDRFWAANFPGHLALPSAQRAAARAAYQAEQPELAAEAERRQFALARMGAMLNAGPDGGSDLAIMFSKRVTRLIRDGGFLGFVLPNSGTLGAARTWVEWRRMLRERGALRVVSTLSNRNGWLFNDVDNRYSIIFLAWQAGPSSVDAATAIRGRFYDRDSFLSAEESGALRATAAELEEWTPGKAFIPAPPRHGSGDLLRRFIAHPRLGEQRQDFSVAAAHDGTASVTEDFIRRSEGSACNIQVVQGRNIAHWTIPSVVATVAEDIIPEELRSIIAEPRIAFRQIARPDDQHSFIVAPLPPMTFAKETSYALRFSERDPEAELFVLAVLSSQVFDWQARCWNDFRILPSLFGFFRVPEFQRESKLHQRIVSAARALLDAQQFGAWGATGSTSEPSLAAVSELDALVALAYGLNDRDLATIFETFHVSRVDEARRDLAVEHLLRLL